MLESFSIFFAISTLHLLCLELTSSQKEGEGRTHMSSSVLRTPVNFMKCIQDLDEAISADDFLYPLINEESVNYCDLPCLELIGS